MVYQIKTSKQCILLRKVLSLKTMNEATPSTIIVSSFTLIPLHFNSLVNQCKKDGKS